MMTGNCAYVRPALEKLGEFARGFEIQRMIVLEDRPSRAEGPLQRDVHT